MKTKITLLNGDIANQYGYSDINIKKVTLADKDPYNVNTFIVSAEKWFIIKIPKTKDDDELSKELNKAIKDYLEAINNDR